MLKSLVIQNYALIDELSVEFSRGLVIITGETGAGKSILVDALGLVVGERASSEMVRSSADKAIVEAVFTCSEDGTLRGLLAENGLESYGEIALRREVSSKGQSRCFINDSLVTLSVLKQTGDLLVDLHGQHEHQSLLRVENHIGMLDDFGGLTGQVAEFHTARAALLSSIRHLEDLRQREELLLEKKELYVFQIQEIDAVSPQLDEEATLETELKILENAEKLASITEELYGLFYENEKSVHDLLGVARDQLNALVDIDHAFEEAVRECASAEAVVNELAKSIQKYNTQIESNPERLEEIRQRLGKFSLLKKKYGGSMESVLAHRERIGKEVALAVDFESAMNRARENIDVCRNHCGLLAKKLTTRRREAAGRIDKAIVVELAKLGIANGRFETRIVQQEQHGDSSDDCAWFDERKMVKLNSRGWDSVEFHISTNVGEEVKPLIRVASGGEVSRIMLALKTILAESDRLPVMIFDEIDVGVSGRTAQAVGLSLKNLSAVHQVIAITHLPQIAGLGDSHFAVIKSESKKRTSTSMHLLSEEERVREVAKLMSGAEVTDAGLIGARELMGLK